MDYETFNLWLATFLRACHVFYVETTLTHHNKTVFHFQKDDRIPALVDSYLRGASVDVRDIETAYKFLVSEIRKVRNGGGSL